MNVMRIQKKWWKSIQTQLKIIRRCNHTRALKRKHKQKTSWPQAAEAPDREEKA